jgi:lipooligosaccharide transport system ATP-binding protein
VVDGSVAPVRIAPMIVRLQAVTKRFGDRTAVDDLDLAIPAGSCFGLLGPNGAGKTTTLRMIYGATQPTAGRVEVFGLDVNREPRAVRARLGVTLQDNVLIEVLNPVENLRIFGRYHLLREPELSARIEALIDFLELRSHARVPVRNLSGGFQRRLAIALSLINDPELLILDEPTTGLDPAVRLALWSKIRDLRAAGTTVVLTTHYMDEAQRLCDRVAVMAGGRILADGAPDALISEHLSPQAIELDCAVEAERVLAAHLPPETRTIHAGGRLVVYADDAAALVESLDAAGIDNGRRRTIRPTNLEDLYLHLTGASLADGA